MSRRLWLGLTLGCLVGCAGEKAPDTSYLQEIEAWQKDRAEKLQAEDGWLSLVGLHWLAEGDQPFGSDPEYAIRFEAEGIPPLAGLFSVQGTEVRLIPAEDAALTVNGEPAAFRVLRDDSEDSPDLLRLGRFTFHVIRRGNRVGVRVKDPEAPTRLGFRGLTYYPADPVYRVEARLERYPEPKQIEISSAIGTTEEMESPGRLAFRLSGISLSLEPLIEGDDQSTLFIIFQDATSGRETYGAGRYLYAQLDGDRATLDFNKAYNPPCAFTPHATCPLPPRGNRLDLSVRAGEKSYGDH